jgi:ribonuclease BN (tRNA processing enzyme)
VLAAGAGILGIAGPAVAAQTVPGGQGQPTDYSQGARVVLLGTAGGPPPNRNRCGISSALVVDGAVYLIDAGRGAVTQYMAAGLKLASLAGIFLTHLHADHVAEYYNFFLLGGNANPGVTDTVPNSTPVYGPGPAGGLPPWHGAPPAPIVDAADPTPGLAAFTEHCNNAYAYSTNVFLRDSFIRNPTTLMDVHELRIPDVGASFTNRAPSMQPFTVMQDENVTVTAILVPHGPVFPSFAYRFDTRYGSVTFSGDTTYTDNIPTLAEGTDILVHEAINVQGWAGPDALKAHLLTSHVEVQRVGSIAAAAGAGRLVLSHIGDLASPVISIGQWTAWARTGYTGRVDIGDDLQVFTLGS